MTASSIGDHRDGFLGRISAGLGAPTHGAASAPPPLRLDRSVARVVGADEPVLPVFTRNASAVGMTVHSVEHAGLTRTAVEILDRAGASSVAITAHPVLAGVVEAVRGSTRRVLVGDDASLGSLFEVDAGITGVEAAIAETGSLVCCSGPGRGRGPSLVAPVHIAVVAASQIRPDLLDYWDGFAAARGSLPSSVVLISGPSKTADIEGVLITGVHGPRRVHVVIVTDR